MPKLKATKTRLKKILWGMVSKYVRAKEESCYTCNKFLPYENRTAGHYWTQGGHQKTRFDLMNVHTQCVSCNSFKSGNLAPYAEKLMNEYGEKEFLLLNLRAKDSTPFERKELEIMIEEYKSKLSNL